MVKYNDDLKLAVVLDYLNNSLSYQQLAKKYGVVDRTQISRWVRAFKEYGIEGLARKSKKQFYTVQFKLDVLNFMKQTGASYQDTAFQFMMNNPSLIVNWNRKFLEQGLEGLQEKSKGRPSMSKNRNSKASKQEKEMSREEQLERENELLRLEVAFLKKLKAFRENPNAFLEKSKQSSPLNSNKKDLH